MFSPSKIRRFTPPTCTLEINLLKKVDKPYFRLSFDDPRISEVEQVTLCGDRQQLERLYRVVFERLTKYLSWSFVLPLTGDETPDESECELDLRSLDLVKHQLIVNFPDNHSVSEIDLTTVQLFDLMTALEAYHREVTNLSLPKSQPRKRLLIWGSSAAAAALVIGWGTLIIRNLQQPEPKVTPSSTNKSTETIPEFEAVVPPQVSKSQEPVAKLQLGEPISSAQKLPPPLPVDTPKPQPDSPDPADYPPSQPLDLSALEPPNQTETITVVPETALKPQTAASTTTSQSQAESPDNNSAPSNNEPAIITSVPDADNIEKEPLATEGSLDREDKNFSQTAPQTQNNHNNSALALNSSPVQDRLQQVNRYFQEKWQPPKQLTETIEYRLVINSDGAIAQIFPLGKAAEVYLDRTNIPLMGETLVAPLSERQNLTVRLMLSPDGEVATFAE